MLFGMEKKCMSESISKAKRLPYWDTMKGILIILVVLGHFLWDFTTPEHPGIQFFIVILYFFHMPAFVFISGYFSHSSHSRSIESIMKLVSAYILINGSFILADGFMHHNMNYIVPYYHCWYLLALIVWRLTAGFMTKIRFVLPLSVVAALLIGYFPEIDNTLALSRIIALYPFFLAGWFLSEKKITPASSLPKRKRFFIGIEVITCAMIIIVLAIQNFHYTQDALVFFPYQHMTDIGGRAAVFLIATLMIAGIVLLCPSRPLPLLTQAGENSLTVYLLHRYFALAFTEIYPPESTLKIFFGATILSLFSTYILQTKAVSRTLNAVITSGAEFLTPGKKCQQILVKGIYSLLLVSLLMLPMAKCAIQAYTTNQPVEDPIYRVMTTEQQNKYKNAYRILFAGDLLLLEDQVKNGYHDSAYGYDMMFDYTRKYIESADLAIGVFEGPMAGETAGYSTGNFDDDKMLYLNFPDAFGLAVKNAGFDVVTTANNHVLDKGITGLKRTLDTLDSIGLTHVGSYRSAEEKAANRVRIVNQNGLRIAILAYTYGANYYEEDDLLDGDHSYATSLLVDPKSKNFERVKENVHADFAAARAQHPDLIVVLPHMGEQFQDEPNDYQKKWCEIFYENGADIILGDHTHSVQPIEMKEIAGKMRLTAYCPGNYANIYREYNGDCMALEEVYVDRDTKQIIGGAVIPMWTASALNGNYRPLPIAGILKDEKLREALTTYDFERVKEAAKHITKVMLGQELPIDAIRERLYFDEKGFMREPAEPLRLTDEMRSSPFYQIVSRADRVCFVGDSVTEGTKNGGYGWYEPMAYTLSGKTTAFAKGGETSKWLLENADEIANQDADVYVVAIGTNDIRYRDKKICAMTESEYVSTLRSLVNRVREHNPKAKFIFIAPWTSTDGDKNSRLNYADKMNMNKAYSRALAEYCAEEEFLFVDPNKRINAMLRLYPDSKYLVDFIHPNSAEGIRLYSETVLLP